MRKADNTRSTIRPHAMGAECVLDVDHRWVGDSRHSTSEGVIVYESCSCGARRIRRGGVPIAQTSGMPLARARASSPRR